MISLDIIIYIVLLIAAIFGWRSGLTRQLFSLAGVILAFIFAGRYSVAVGSLLGLTPQWASIVGYVVVFILVIIATSLLGRLLQKTFKFVGLGIIDNILGAVLGAVKFALIIALLLLIFIETNLQFGLVNKAIIDNSSVCQTVIKASHGVDFNWGELYESSNIIEI